MNQQLAQPSFSFTTPFNVEIIEVKGQKRVFLEGIISTNHLDLVNDVVTKSCLESMERQIKSGNLKLDLEHESFRGDSIEEKELNKAKIPIGKMFEADVKAIEKDKFALFVKSELNPFEDRFEKTMGSVKEGFLDAYSIAFIPIKTEEQIVDGKTIRMLDDVVLLNVALTGNPINTEAKNRDIFLKSIQSLEDYKNKKKLNPEIENQLEVKHNHISDNKIKLEEVKDMEEDKKDETQEAEGEESTESKEPEKKEEGSDEGESNDEPESKDDEPETGEEEDAEKKEMKSQIKTLIEEVKELKAKIKLPVRKSKVEIQNKDAPELKSVNPLDVIA